MRPQKLWGVLFWGGLLLTTVQVVNSHTVSRSNLAGWPQLSVRAEVQ